MYGVDGYRIVDNYCKFINCTFLGDGFGHVSGYISSIYFAGHLSRISRNSKFSIAMCCETLLVGRRPDWSSLYVHAKCTLLAQHVLMQMFSR